MTILSAQSIRHLCKSKVPYTYIEGSTSTVETEWTDQHPMITPFVEREVCRGRSFGLSSCGYDIRVKSFKTEDGDLVNKIRMSQSQPFVLAVSMERIKMPNNVVAIVHDKSSWAREGLAVQNTVLEPGWEGFITLEFSFHKTTGYSLWIESGDPIAQLIFHRLDQSTDQPYSGKYQNQADVPVDAIYEKPTQTTQAEPREWR